MLIIRKQKHLELHDRKISSQVKTAIFNTSYQAETQSRFRIVESIFHSTSALMLSTLQTDSFKLLFLCFFPVSHSFQYHSPVFHKTKIYHTCYILAQYHKKVSFQLYLFFQVKDNNVKMEGFIKQIKTLENQLTSLYKDSLYPRKAPLHVWRLAAKCP